MSDKHIIHYFFSGHCYKKGSDIVLRRFDGLTKQEYIGNPDPISARAHCIKTQVEICEAAGLKDVHVHIDQMNVV